MSTTISEAFSKNLIDMGNGKFKKVLTLAFIQKEDKVLLGLKKRGFGKGLWNGFGGKVDPGEEIIDAAVREIKEECGLSVLTKDMRKFGVIEFEFENNPIVLEVHAFNTSTYTGDVTESEEMLPQWYSQDAVPHSQMWADDKVWFPLFLKGHKFKAYFHFRGYETILSYIIRDLDNKELILQSLNWTEEGQESNNNVN